MVRVLQIVVLLVLPGVVFTRLADDQKYLVLRLHRLGLANRLRAMADWSVCSHAPPFSCLMHIHAAPHDVRVLEQVSDYEGSRQTFARKLATNC